MQLATRTTHDDHSGRSHHFSFTIQTDEYRSQPIPGIEEKGPRQPGADGGMKIGDCFVRVTDLPAGLDDWMKVNPRVPDRNSKGILSGPVIKGILKTLRDNQADMAIKNQGIYLLADDVRFTKLPGGIGQLQIILTDTARHGIVNGGHTYAAIRTAVEEADDLSNISSAYVRLHILQGIDEEKVPEIAEGLNRSKQVDDASLDNLRGHFDNIKSVMEGKPGSDQIMYSQGEDGEIHITEVLVYLALFNSERYSKDKHPYRLYRSPSAASKMFEDDTSKSPSPTELLIPRVHEILQLSDMIRRDTPAAAKRVGFQFGRMKVGKDRAASVKHRSIPLPFVGENTDYRVPSGWLLPMLAAFRANVRWDLSRREFSWRMPLNELFPKVIVDLVSVCVSEHRDNGLRPEWVGKRESAYRQCYDKVLLQLALSGKLN